MTLLPWRHTGKETSGRSSLFEDLALPLLPALYNVAYWLTRNATDAEDLVQETLLKSLRGFEGFEADSNFKAWIFRILRNTYLTSRSGLAARRTVALEEELDEGGKLGPGAYPEAAIDRETPELNLIRLADRATLQSAMEKLPPPLLEIVLLCDVEELKYKEIASILEVPIGTVMSRLARARAHLRKSLEGNTFTREFHA
ncbi:sigma-70 family RNA polymerase sigma factor [Granulicella sp. dw_53]|uniref:sigma-70 family RNA polymerase sigma factor n=1 Tax=Granulicella sp. dw_53 TaxID=2719792 RepID=UPI001BD6264B|nr:sigma-70 family RNA polymerase sigma factor [Granulicella sp. dw_53]